MLKQTASSARLKWHSKNAVLLGAATLALAAGYGLLAQGSTTVAPLLLVLGYCVLFPLGLTV